MTLSNDTKYSGNSFECIRNKNYLAGQKSSGTGIYIEAHTPTLKYEQTCTHEKVDKFFFIFLFILLGVNSLYYFYYDFSHEIEPAK